MSNIFFDYIKNNDLINDNFGLSENEALKLSLDLERILENAILRSIRHAQTQEAKDLLIDILLFIKNLES